MADQPSSLLKRQSDAPDYLDNDGDPPAWLREDLASTPAEVVAWIENEFGWDELDPADVSGPVLMAPLIGPTMSSEERWCVVPDEHAEDAHARYWKLDN